MRYRQGQPSPVFFSGFCRRCCCMARDHILGRRGNEPVRRDKYPPEHPYPCSFCHVPFHLHGYFHAVLRLAGKDSVRSGVPCGRTGLGHPGIRARRGHDGFSLVIPRPLAIRFPSFDTGCVRDGDIFHFVPHRCRKRDHLCRMGPAKGARYLHRGHRRTCRIVPRVRLREAAGPGRGEVRGRDRTGEHRSGHQVGRVVQDDDREQVLPPELRPRAERGHHHLAGDGHPVPPREGTGRVQVRAGRARDAQVPFTVRDGGHSEHGQPPQYSPLYRFQRQYDGDIQQGSPGPVRRIHPDRLLSPVPCETHGDRCGFQARRRAPAPRDRCREDRGPHLF